MDIKEILLTEGETSRARHQFTLDYKRSIAQNKAQCLKLLKVLEDEGMIAHEKFYPYSITGVGIHSTNCWLCKLKKDLGG